MATLTAPVTSGAASFTASLLTSLSHFAPQYEPTFSPTCSAASSCSFHLASSHCSPGWGLALAASRVARRSTASDRSSSLRGLVASFSSCHIPESSSPVGFLSFFLDFMSPSADTAPGSPSCLAAARTDRVSWRRVEALVPTRAGLESRRVPGAHPRLDGALASQRWARKPDFPTGCAHAGAASIALDDIPRIDGSQGRPSRRWYAAGQLVRRV
mmetsp:Transcript_2049/g.9286  ORF Transcript_2049/g.9286 Transcript_2049/m.9286 type:complete len:214 (-) Transcript_2049:29-670(-)